MIPLRDNVASETRPVVAYAILAINIVVFVVQWAGGQGYSGAELEVGGKMYAMTGFEESVLKWGLRPIEITQGISLAPLTPVPEWMTGLTSMFMHGGWMHIIGNMLFLWIFADNVEDELGHVRFALFYLVVGAAGAALQVAVSPDSVVPMVGASGAIAGVMGGYVLLYPRARVLTLIPLGVLSTAREIPAVWFMGIWILFQIISAPFGGGTAWFAHIGGFVAGLALVKPLAIRPRRPYITSGPGGGAGGGAGGRAGRSWRG